MITYEALVKRMEDVYTAHSGCTAEAAGDTDIRLRVLAGEVYTLLGHLETCKAALLPQTAAGDALDSLAAERGLARKAARRAQGRLKFSNSAAQIASVFIPKGTVCKTAGDPPVRFLTLEDGSIPINTVGTVEVAAEAEAPGPGGNAQPGTVTVLVSNVPLVAAVTNDAAFSGGRDAEGDDALRARLLDTNEHPSNGSNTGYYRALALKQPGVSSCYVTVDAGAPGTVAVYLAAAGGAATAETVAATQRALDAARGINVTVSVKPAVEVAADLALRAQAKAGLDKSAVRTACEQAVRGYLGSLPIGQAPNWMALACALEGTGMLLDVQPDSFTLPHISRPQDVFHLRTLTVTVV